MNDYAFFEESQTKNTMSNPFEDTQLPDALPQNKAIEAVITSLKLFTKDDDVWFSLGLRPTDSELMTHNERLNYRAKGVAHKMAGKTAATIAAIIGGRIENRRITTSSGEYSETAITAACDAAVGKLCVFKVKINGEYTNMIHFEMLD